MKKLAKLNPHISHTVWGGDKLSKVKNIETNQPIGETWEVSTHEKGSAKLGSNKLSDLFTLRYLVKFIDTNANLSIQVHPGDEYAKMHENSMGKTECWLIMDARPGCGIYIGLKKGITKKEFQTALKNNLDINNYLNYKEVKAGDFFYIPAGTIHAIGSGVTLCEVQQSSGITYRVWDWNRMGLDGKPRELHIDKAMDVIDFSEKFNSDVLDKSNRAIFDSPGITNLVTHKDFKVEIFNYPKDHSVNIRLKQKDSLILLEGELMGDEELAYMKSAICLDAGEFEFKTKNKTSFLIVSENGL